MFFKIAVNIAHEQIIHDHPYCELCQEDRVHSDVLVRTTLLLRDLDAVRTLEPVGRDSSTRRSYDQEVLIFNFSLTPASESDFLDRNLTGPSIRADWSQGAKAH